MTLRWTLVWLLASPVALAADTDTDDTSASVPVDSGDSGDDGGDSGDDDTDPPYPYGGRGASDLAAEAGGCDRDGCGCAQGGPWGVLPLFAGLGVVVTRRRRETVRG